MMPGEVYWVTSAGIAHPHVVAEDAGTGQFVMCVISTNLKRISLPGNVLLDAGEANLPKRSIVLVSRTIPIHPDQAGAYIGSLSSARLQQIRSGIQMIANFSRTQP